MNRFLLPRETMGMNQRFKRAISIYRNEGLGVLLSQAFSLISYTLQKWLRTIQLAFSNENYLAGTGEIFRPVLGRNPYIWFLEQTSGRGLVKRNIEGVPMYLNTSDRGLSTDLLVRGIREEQSMLAYVEELRKLKDELGELTVLEVGANIGYYVVMPSRIFNEDDTIYAIEPSPVNITVLNANVSLNRLDSIVELLPIAISGTDGTTTLKISEKGNQSRIEVESIESAHHGIIGSTEVETRTIDTLLEEKGLEPSSINVLRMDLEGGEYELLTNATSLLDADTPLLLFVETHPNVLSDENHREMIDLLRDADFEVVDAYSMYGDVDSLHNDRIYHDGFKLILKRGY